MEQKSLGKQHNHNQISRFHLCTFALSQGYSLFLYNTFWASASLFSSLVYYILQLKEMLTSPLFNLREVNDLSDELGSLSAAIEVCYHRY